MAVRSIRNTEREIETDGAVPAHSIRDSWPASHRAFDFTDRDWQRDWEWCINSP
jgi:hypothetical protein